MKKIVLLLLILLPISSFAQDCAKFKTGTFRLKSEDGNFVPNYSIERKKNIQIEKIGENYVKTKVKWIDDCTYKLIHITSDILDLEKGTVTTCKILQTFENGYHGIGTSSFTEEAVPFTMYKID
ncbi:hypothetical protein N9Y60_00370 [Crocinitomicaceae bacterium]|nr:hypothetical protein [Crocinitomicaceae bacterium]